VTTPLPVGPLSPYVTPELLTQSSTGVSWQTIPPGASVTGTQRLAAQVNICTTATAMVDEICGQPLRATADTYQLFGPGVRVGVPGNGAPVRLVLTRWPVLEIISVQVAPNTLPWTFTPVPSSALAIQYPVVGLYGSSAPASAAEGGQAILMDPCWLSGNGNGQAGNGPGWGPSWGHNQYVIQVQYINGWPHTALTAAATARAGTLSVDDCTGWVITAPFPGAPTGATGVVYDAASQEVIQVTAASAAQGPGTLTLAAPLTYAHAAGVMVSTLPQSVVWAATLLGASQALTRGATSTTIRQIPPQGSSGGGERAMSLKKEAACLLAPFARII
jgi:hypothetical protein